MTGIELRSFTSEQNLKAGGVGLSRNPGDQTKNSFINRQIENKVNFS
jgi:hypothetical protein